MAKQPDVARHHRDLRSERAEDMGELNRDVATTEDDQLLREGVDTHDGVGGMKRQAGFEHLVRHYRTAASGDDDLVGGDVVLGVYPQRVRTGEGRVAEKRGRVRSVDPVVL